MYLPLFDNAFFCQWELGLLPSFCYWENLYEQGGQVAPLFTAFNSAVELLLYGNLKFKF